MKARETDSLKLVKDIHIHGIVVKVLTHANLKYFKTPQFCKLK